MFEKHYATTYNTEECARVAQSVYYCQTLSAEMYFIVEKDLLVLYSALISVILLFPLC